MEHLGVDKNLFRNAHAFQDGMLHEPEVYLQRPKRRGCKMSVCFYPKTWWWTQSLPWCWLWWNTYSSKKFWNVFGWGKESLKRESLKMTALSLRYSTLFCYSICVLHCSLYFQGAGREGLYVQTEFIAVVAALLIWWSANNVKSKLQES